MFLQARVAAKKQVVGSSAHTQKKATVMKTQNLLLQLVNKQVFAKLAAVTAATKDNVSKIHQESSALKNTKAMFGKKKQAATLTNAIGGAALLEPKPFT